MVLFGYDKKQALPCVNHYNLQCRGLILHVLQERVYHFGPFNSLKYTFPDWPIESVEITDKYNMENLVSVYLNEKQEVSFASETEFLRSGKYVIESEKWEFDKYYYTLKEVENELRVVAVRSKLTGDLVLNEELEDIVKKLNMKLFV